jgi:caffeoyl-CoA O-methyltransferase
MDRALLEDIEQKAKQDGIATVPEVVGRLLSVLATAMQANRILEIGTGYGYATVQMALAQPPAGKIWTFDPYIERTEVARQFFDRAGVGDRIEIINQPALEVLHIFPQRNLDIAFVDAPRRDYAEYLKQCLHVLKLSGLVILNGLTADDETDAFNRAFLKHPQLEATILPLGAGIGIGARKA